MKNRIENVYLIEEYSDGGIYLDFEYEDIRGFCLPLSPLAARQLKEALKVTPSWQLGFGQQSGTNALVLAQEPSE